MCGSPSGHSQSVPRIKGGYYPMTSNNGRPTQRANRIPSKHLFRYSINVREVGLISKRGEPIVPNDPVDFCLGFTLELRVHHHG